MWQATGPGWHADVVLDAQWANQPPVLRHIAYAKQGTPMSRHVHEVSAIQLDHATRNRQKPHNTLEGGGFAGAIASDERHQPPAGISKLIPRKILKPLIVTQISSTCSMV